MGSNPIQGPLLLFAKFSMRYCYHFSIDSGLTFTPGIDPHTDITEMRYYVCSPFQQFYVLDS